MRTVRIGNRIIGDGYPAFIIAEIGLNHNGNFKLAKDMIYKAKEAGADAVKFQIFRASELYKENEEPYRLFKGFEFDESQWGELRDIAKEADILFGASVFGEWSADLLKTLNSDFYKIASGDLTNLPMLKYISAKGLPIIISTGASYIGEVEEALETIYSQGNQDVIVLHCVSNYPTRYEDVNLNAIKTMKSAFNVPVGFSDHTIGPLIPAIAVALGANAIEKHFTLDRNLPGPDHKLSLDVQEFKTMVEWVRIAEQSLGDGVKKPAEREVNNRKQARKSLYAARKIIKGEIIKREDIKVLRPIGGIEPKYLDLIVGRKVIKDIEEGEPLKWEHFMENR